MASVNLFHSEGLIICNHFRTYKGNCKLNWPILYFHCCNYLIELHVTVKEQKKRVQNNVLVNKTNTKGGALVPIASVRGHCLPFTL